jgi:hypothetical protein
LTIRLCQDGVGVLGPDERFAAFVPAVDEAADGLDELANGVEAAAADGLAGDDAKKISTMFNQDPDVGVKCSVIRGLRASQALMR